MDIISEIKMSPLAIFYYEEEEIMLWKDFLEHETKTKVIAPVFQRLPSSTNEAATRYKLFDTINSFQYFNLY